LPICGLLSFSFREKPENPADVSGQFSKPPVLQGELTTDVLTLDRFRQAVSQVEVQNSNWWIPRLGLTESNRVEAGLETALLRYFQSRFPQGFRPAHGRTHDPVHRRHPR
jgi:type VI secretion system protein ImpL